MAIARKTVRKPAARKGLAGLFDNVKTLVYALLIAAVVRTIVFEPFNIPSASMVPTLLVGDFVFVTKFSYGYSRFSMPFSPHLFDGRIFGSLPHRGDVVVFRYTRDTSQDWIKRVIGLPHDHIQVKGGHLFINGTEAPREVVGDYQAEQEGGGHILAREFIEALPDGPRHRIIKYSDDEHYNIGSELDPNNTPDYVVPDGMLFMMGDNRDNSEDSRFQNDLGFVPVENLIGRAQFIFFSFDVDHASWFRPWEWPFDIRFGRLLKAVH